MKNILLIIVAAVSSGAFASGSVTCESTHAPDKFSINWGATHGIGSPMFGHVNVVYRDKKYALGLEAKKTEVGTTALPMLVVGYWVDGADKILVRITDDQILRTLVHIEASKGKAGLEGEAYLQLTDKMPSRKMAVRCSVE